MMKILILMAAVSGVMFIITMSLNMAKNSGIDEQRMAEYEIILEDKENDQKIASRPDDDADTLLDRMRSQND